MQATMLSVVLVFCVIHFVCADGEVEDVKKVEEKPSDVQGSSSVQTSQSPANTVNPQNNGSPAEKVDPPNGGTPANKDVPANEGSPANKVVPPDDGTAANKVVPANEGSPTNKVVPPDDGTLPNKVVPADEGSPANKVVSPNEGSPENAVIPPNDGTPANTVVPPNEGSPANTAVPQDFSIRKKLSEIGQRIRQRTSSTAETLRDIKQTLHQKFYDVAGDLYEKGAPVNEYLRGVKQTLHQKVYKVAGELYDSGAPARTAFANSKQEHQQHLEKALEIWNKIELKGKTQEERIEMLIDLMGEEMVKRLPLYTKIQPIEESSTTKYFCGAKGLLKDLRSITKVGMTIKPVDGDGFTAEIDYKFNDLHFNYNIFFINALGALKRKGYLDILFHDNNIKVKLKISDFLQIIPKLFRKQCIVSVVNVEVTRLEFFHSSLLGVKKDHKRKLLSGKINDYLGNNQEKLRARFEQRVLVEMHKALTTDDAWICKGEEIAELVKSKGGSTDEYVVSETFKKECGEDLYIEPYQGP